jgi:rod shape-determining protein MreC
LARGRNAARLGALVALSLLLLALSPLSVADDVEALGSALLEPVLRALHEAARPVSDVVLHAGQLQQLSEENADLREQVAHLEAEAAALRDARAATDQTRALRAAVGDAAGYLSAAVIVRDPAPGRRGLLIDRGARDGVVAGHAVLGPGATLVGIVAEVDASSARVRLLDDPHSAVATVLQQSRTPGALGADERGLRLDFVATGATVAVGDLLQSSPLGGRLPAGLLIGRVSDVTSRPEALFQDVRVEPYTDYDRLEHVLVVTAFTPEVAGS